MNVDEAVEAVVAEILKEDERHTLLDAEEEQLVRAISLKFIDREEIRTSLLKGMANGHSLEAQLEKLKTVIKSWRGGGSLLHDLL